MSEIDTALVLRTTDRAEALATLTGLGQEEERAEAMLATADRYEYATALREGIAVTRPSGSDFYAIETFQAPAYMTRDFTEERQS